MYRLFRIKVSQEIIHFRNTSFGNCIAQLLVFSASLGSATDRGPFLASERFREGPSRHSTSFVLRTSKLIAFPEATLLRHKVGFQKLGTRIVIGQGCVFIPWMLPLVVLLQVTWFLDKAANMAFRLPFVFPISPNIKLALC